MNRIARYLREKELSQKAFAELLGVTQPTVHAWANGSKIPEDANVTRIAEVIGVSAAELLVELRMPAGAVETRASA